MKPITLSIIFLTLINCTPKKKPLPDPLEAGWNDQPVCEVLEENENMRALRCTFPPGVGHERHYHAEHFGYTIKGSTFRITDASGTREVNVPTGSSFYNEKIEWHEVLNIGDSTAVFLILEPKQENKLLLPVVVNKDFIQNIDQCLVFVL